MEIFNHLLCELPLELRHEVIKVGHRIQLKSQEIIQVQGELQTRCYFIENGVVSLSRQQPNGTRVEAALVGREGFVGSSTGAFVAFTEAKMALAGNAICLETRDLQVFLRRESSLQDILGRYQRFQLDEAQLNAACNGVHSVQQRLAKWLLLCLDRVDAPKLALTQETLAEVLGVQRTTVTAVLARLAQEGAIRRRRGLVHVIDRARLQALSCACYEDAVERLPELGLPEPWDESACAA